MFAAARTPLGSPATFKHVASHAYPFPSSPASPRILPSPNVQSPVMHHPIPRRSTRYVQDDYFPYIPPPRYPLGLPRFSNPVLRSSAENNITYFTEPSTARPRFNARLSSIMGEAMRENIPAVESDFQPRTRVIVAPAHSQPRTRQRGGTIWEGHPNSPHLIFGKPSANPETVVEDVAGDSDSIEAKTPKPKTTDKRGRSVAFCEAVDGTASMTEIYQGVSRLDIREDKYTLNTKKDVRRQTPGALESGRESYLF